MNTLVRFFAKKTTSGQLPLGRWAITGMKDNIDKKIDFANHDHCGGELCQKVFVIKNKKKIINTEDEDFKYLPYVM